MRTIIFGTYDTAMHPRIATIAEGLAARGFDVAECNIPLGLATADRVDMLAKPWKAGGAGRPAGQPLAGLAARATAGLADRTWSSSATWATSTCTLRACCTAAARCRSCSTT